ncbi:hypothetical protein E2C01_039875 [Portunus trituberculatus]|uniref:Uncharacterized protein n=1 Tax=Portunus trituberculatus TaxID=210409 RepID=A0A5B7FKY1_PORTR|nr:hypothetical protein [Portunus trituberculatus]
MSLNQLGVFIASLPSPCPPLPSSSPPPHHSTSQLPYAYVKEGLAAAVREHAVMRITSGGRSPDGVNVAAGEGAKGYGSSH